jgi:hypothetical protein
MSEQLEKDYVEAVALYNEARNAKPRNFPLIRVRGEAATKLAQKIIAVKAGETK